MGIVFQEPALEPRLTVRDNLRGALLGSFFFPCWLSIAVLVAFIVVMTWLATRIFTTGEDA